MNRKTKSALISFCIELLVYSVLVVGYFFLVLHLVGDWLQGLFDHNRKLYAATALGLIICQGVLLEVLTRFLLALITTRREGQ
jgi:hypothetical protein